jgi:preprotein translocase subunit SecY
MAASVTIPTQLAAAGASAPVPDATGARPDPADARFTSSSPGKVSNFIIFSIILYIHIYCLLVVMFGFVMSDGLS